MRFTMRTFRLLAGLAAVALLATCDDEPSGPNDVTSPARVTSLTVIDAGPNSLTLQWTAPGDDGGSGTAEKYQIRRSLSAIDDSNFGAAIVVAGPPAPLAGGTQQQFTVTGVDTLLVNHFALRAVDEVGNTSQVSNDAVWRYETTPPARVTDLTVVASGDNSLTLQWTAPGDDGTTGTATGYEIRRSTAAITAGNFGAATLVPNPPAPLLAGTVQQFTVTGIDTTVIRHFALRAFDKLDNVSLVSNDAQWVPGLVHIVKDIPAFKDNSMYEESPDSSNGKGIHIFTGKAAAGNPFARRALLAFAISDSIPAGAAIDSVELTLRLSRVPAGSGTKTVTLHRVTADWGEGTSDAPGEEGFGGTAQANDATWSHRFYNTTLWTTAGGDFVALVSDQKAVSTLGFYTWKSTQMKNDVQGWLDTPAGNFGWVLVGDESISRTARRFDSRENPTAANRPRLRVYYSVVK